nr:unnamed protein product [Callosobruchus chinensis]
MNMRLSVMYQEE